MLVLFLVSRLTVSSFVTMSSIRSLFSALFAAACAIHFADALHFTPREADANLLSSYDYIIVGAGCAGMTVANRLSENSAGMLLANHYQLPSLTTYSQGFGG